MGLSNLPPGVTQGMIDRYYSGPCEDCASGFHEGCEDDECSCPKCEDDREADAAEVRFEERREAEMDRRHGG